MNWEVDKSKGSPTDNSPFGKLAGLFPKQVDGIHRSRGCFGSSCPYQKKEIEDFTRLRDVQKEKSEVRWHSRVRYVNIPEQVLKDYLLFARSS